MTSLAMPDRSLTQRMEALKLANTIRTYRAGIKRDVAAGRVDLVQLLTDDLDERLETMKLWDLMLCQPKRGRVKVGRIFTQCRISPSKTIGGLSPRQRRELADFLRR